MGASSNRNSLSLAACVLASTAVVICAFYARRQKQERTSRNETHDKGEATDCESTVTDKGLSAGSKSPIGKEIQLNGSAATENRQTSLTTDRQRILTRRLITIAHGSVTGTCRKMAETLQTTLEKAGLSVQMGTTEEWDWWDEFLNDEEGGGKSKPTKADTPLLILLLPTYTGGTWTPPSAQLQSTLDDLQHDWRIAKFPLRDKLRVAVWGVGSSAYNDQSMGQPARQAVRNFQKLGAKNIVRLAVGDDAVGDHAQETFETWKLALLQRLEVATDTQDRNNSSCGCGTTDKSSNGEGCCSTGTSGPTDSGCCKEEQLNEDDEYDGVSSDEENEEPQVLDVEDMGDAMLASNDNNTSSEPPEMVTPSQAKALKKEGYKLIGTHSAVKLCRWTKHQLRGRGGCYKHTFYGITSYQCMEATPSLACANKCVFCWRHHKNPVGKEWRWKTDDPEFIVKAAVDQHVQMIKEARGIPGVKMDRWQEALTVRHCALSLVGEPIMYPRIDDLLKGLHHRNISTFLVTNGQHPDAIGSLIPITQLYVSVDAPTKESLIEIDRPLFQDAWERLKQSLTSLKNKGQRTVARLTVVKGWNSDEVEGYAKLIALGHVSLVELKGVTFCGKSDASNLNMSNSPWHHEVVDLTRVLQKELDLLRENDSSVPEYDLACEHKHSCSVLLARTDQFTRIDSETGKRKWQTWIDYDEFQKLSARHEKDPTFSFGVRDYVADTPEWALFGAQEEGFDPTDQRHRRKKKHPKYTRYDVDGIPTHNDQDEPLSQTEREELRKLMEERKRQIGSGTIVTELKGGEKEITDASLMFRGLVVERQ